MDLMKMIPDLAPGDLIEAEDLGDYLCPDCATTAEFEFGAVAAIVPGEAVAISGDGPLFVKGGRADGFTVFFDNLCPHYLPADMGVRLA